MNCWTTYPQLCQLVHPWHWLTYGNNAGAFASLMSLAALVGLVFYTRYTKNMMKVALETRRAEIIPYVVVEKRTPENIFVDQLEVLNLGGPAVNCNLWQARVSDSFSIGSTFLEKPDGVIATFIGPIRKDAKITIRIEHNADQTFLTVLECRDLANERHQWHALLRRKGVSYREYEVQMIFPTMYMTPWKKWITDIRTRYNIYRFKRSTVEVMKNKH
jgi:hypothetical protein